MNRRALLVGAALLAVGYLPLAFLGPGTDLDVGGVYNAGRSILDGDYRVSRPPGAPVFESVSAVLHAVGGSTLVNLASAAMAGLTALAVARLLGRSDVPHAEWFGIAVLANPFVWVAGTSMVDFLWATALVLWGFERQRARQWVPAAVLYALAAGCRLSTLALVAAFVVADWLGDPPVRRRLMAMAGAVGALIALVFLPPYLQLGMAFLKSDVPVSTWLVQLARFGYKNAFFFGPIMIVLVAVHLPRLWRALPARWGTSTVLRGAVLGFVFTQVLYLRFPWKLAHLIPALVCVVLVLATTRVLSRTWIAVLVVSQLVFGVVTVNVARPDQPHEATGGRLSIDVVEGPWLLDLRCRLEGDRAAYRRPGEVEPLLDTWNCVIPWTE